MADSRQVDCFSESCVSPRNDDSIVPSLRENERSEFSWQSTKDSQVKFRANEVDLSKVCIEIQTRIAKNCHIIFLLQGDIGAGKTTLVKAFAKYVGIKDSVTSPTFSLLHIYGAESSLGNSSLGALSALGENFGEQQTPSLVLSPKFSPNTKFPPQILELDSNKSDLHDSTESSLRGRIADSHEAIQKNKIDCHDFAMQNLAMTGNNESVESYNDEKISKIYHYDLFNRNLSELLDLGLLDLLGENGIHFVEWGDSQLFDIIKNAFENICIISIHKTKNDRIYEFKESF